MKKTLSKVGLTKLRMWLGKDGREFFTVVQEKYKDIALACWVEGEGPFDPPKPKTKPTLSEAINICRGRGAPRIPHPVHLREGMGVRNFLRMLPECADWDAHDYDNNWAALVKEALGI